MQTGHDLLVTGSKASLIVAIVLGLTYMAIVGVALFHTDPQRRADARLLLKGHRFGRKQSKR